MFDHHRASWLIASSLWCTACATAYDAGSSPFGARAASLVHGSDDRTEYFEASVEARERLAQSAVALLPKDSISPRDRRLSPLVPSWADADGLCPEEPFADQPAAAFCSGVLVDWDLVLTAGHCVRALGLADIAVVFGYYYADVGELDIGAGDVLDTVEILAEALDPQGIEPRLDYAWIRLSRPVLPPRRPVAISLDAPLEPGAPLLTLSAPGGVPFKADSGGQIQDARAQLRDYFTADTDTSHGSSGGGAFDEQLSLVGILARGGEDLEQTEQGCLATVTIPDGAPSEEQFSYAASALDALCESDPQRSLCRADCGDPCETLPIGANRADGCALTLTSKSCPCFWLVIAGISVWRRLRRKAGPPRMARQQNRESAGADNTARGRVHTRALSSGLRCKSPQRSRRTHW